MNDAALTNLLAACRAYAGGRVDAQFNAAAQAFYASAIAQPKIMARAARELSRLPPPGAAILANMLGTIVEKGGSVERSGAAVWELYMAWLPQIHRGFAGRKELSPRQRQLLDAFQLLGQSAVSHLAAMPRERERAAGDKALMAQLAQLQDYTPGAAWVRQMLLSRSDALLVLHLPSRQGFRLRYQNIVNCFHLFTLIQAAFGETLPGGRVPNRFIIDMARCVTVAEDGNDEPWWRYETVQPDEQGLVEISGEASVETIARIDDRQVILLSSPVKGAALWDTSFFTPQLFVMPANVVLEETLTAREVEEWLARFGLPAGKATSAQAVDKP
ncbi:MULTISPECIES: hypothetical protein [Rhizobium]|jgi:hypothetical protein|uniref:Uncharacterized protein n=1 Tax=Rhizobium tropici TaxID=398 RepID=A0A329YDX7_RHITR|nr:MULTISPECIES: hypothetical protein [Rhizobium]MBB3286563.1 hypothetical protein [Rhizobium sp. BK252]MBB3401243.1 hypothetical protein [Rhizobium sp. BK289]MBB3413821.1 hypothetical protein [Rhizobium sp. BK284]MBB3481708.1 hypothetical protein [Rhizobium sp. BK347]MDK4719700.1 hypothetical protein [Rhizobium sp. CNPSo 3968]